MLASPPRPASRQRPPFECIALLLQGGGALGAYQGGIYEALAQADLHPDWVAGISIGAINAAIIAGNAPERRVERLREFWETISVAPFGVPHVDKIEIESDFTRYLVNQMRAFGIMAGGAPNFFTPRIQTPLSWLSGFSSLETLSYYDIAPLKETLERLVDFDRLNNGDMRLSVGATNVRTGNFIYFDTTTHHIGPEHVMASGALPPGFPAVEVDGEHYWDGGIVSNTPLQWVLGGRPRQDTLAFQVDLWSADGDVPTSLTEIEIRQKDIRFSSRTRAGIDFFKRQQHLRRAAWSLLEQLPAELRKLPGAEILAAEADEKVYNLIQLIYHAKSYERTSKDYEFSRRTVEDHWKSGLDDAAHTLAHPEVLQRPTAADGVFTFDIARAGK